MFTSGKTIYPEMQVPLWYNAAEDLRFVPPEPRYRLILIGEGAGILRYRDCQTLFTAPAVFCLHELEQPEPEHCSGVKAVALYFDPNYINSAFTFENLRHGSDGFSQTEFRDRHWLRPFFQREANYAGYLKIGPLTAGRMLKLLDRIQAELADQPDGYWPCRSRSYLLELLFLTERIYQEPRFIDEVAADDLGEIGKILVYLHTRYKEKVSISGLTQTFQINRTSLAAKFQKATGMSIMSYLIRLRVNLAAFILRDSMVPVAEIIERVGFQDHAHFNRMFHKHFGCSPNEYRQQNCWLIQN